MLERFKARKISESVDTKEKETALWDPSLGERRLDQEVLLNKLGISPGALGIKTTVKIVSNAEELLVASRLLSEGNLVSPEIIDNATEVVEKNKKALGYSKIWAESAESDSEVRRQNAACVGLKEIREHIEALYTKPLAPQLEASEEILVSSLR